MSVKCFSVLTGFKIDYSKCKHEINIIIQLFSLRVLKPISGFIGQKELI